MIQAVLSHLCLYQVVSPSQSSTTAVCCYCTASRRPISAPLPLRCVPHPLSFQLGRSNTNLHTSSYRQPVRSQDHRRTCSCPGCSCSAAHTLRDLARNTHPPLLETRGLRLNRHKAAWSVPHPSSHPRVPGKCPPRTGMAPGDHLPRSPVSTS